MLMSGPESRGGTDQIWRVPMHNLEEAVCLSGWEYFMLLAWPGCDLVGCRELVPNLLVSVEIALNVTLTRPSHQLTAFACDEGECDRLHYTAGEGAKKK